MIMVKYEGMTNLCTGDGQEAHAHHHTRDRDLAITKLDTVEIQHGQTVGRDQTVECKDLVHLDRGDKGASTLSNNVRNSDDVGELGSKRSGN
jgi:hypothetical protein